VCEWGISQGYVPLPAILYGLNYFSTTLDYFIVQDQKKAKDVIKHITNNGKYPFCYQKFPDGSDIITFISKRYIEREMNIKTQLVELGEFDEMVNLNRVWNAFRSLAFKKDQFNLVERRTQPDDIRDDLVRIDVRGLWTT
jgi:hypothetical protein